MAAGVLVKARNTNWLFVRSLTGPVGRPWPMNSLELLVVATATVVGIEVDAAVAPEDGDPTLVLAAFWEVESSVADMLFGSIVLAR